MLPGHGFRGVGFVMRESATVCIAHRRRDAREVKAHAFAPRRGPLLALPPTSLGDLDSNRWWSRDRQVPQLAVEKREGRIEIARQVVADSLLGLPEVC